MMKNLLIRKKNIIFAFIFHCDFREIKGNFINAVSKLYEKFFTYTPRILSRIREGKAQLA